MATTRKLLVGLFMIILKTVVNVYTYATLPIYYIAQQPWKTMGKANRMRSVKENERDPDSAWIGNDELATHEVLQSQTLTESMRKLPKIWGPNTPILAYREALAEQEILDKSGKAKRIDGRSLKKFKQSDYKWLTYADVDRITTNIAKGLMANGVNSGDKVLIFAETRVEWMLCFLSIAKIGACVVTLFANLGDEGITYGINQTEIKLMITTYDLLPKVTQLLPKTPSVSTIVYINRSYEKINSDKFSENVKLISLKEVEVIGESHKLMAFSVPRPSDPLVIMYTSGTTGEPKAAIATHEQFLTSCTAIFSLVKDLVDENLKHTYIAYLPLAHVLELTIEVFLFHGGVKIGYSSPFTLTDSAPGLADGERSDIKMLRPTVITTVPLVLDRIRKEINDKLNARTPVSNDMFNYLMDYKIKWTQKGYKTGIVNNVLCSKVRQQMGGKLEIMIVGGAPLNASTQAWVKSALNVTLIQGYGTTETMGAVLCMDLNDLSYGRVGGPLQKVKVKLIDWSEGGYYTTDKPNPRGELLIGGDIVTIGYYKLDDQTKESYKIDNKGVRWFCTGDIGEMFPDGTFKIIDRRKDLIKLQNGEYVSLGKIESALKSCQYIDNICVCGGVYSNDLVALVIPNPIGLKQLAKELGKHHLFHEQLCADRDITRKIYISMAQTGANTGLSKKEIPVNIKLCADEWSPDNNMLTAAMKLKRRFVEKRYSKDIQTLFTSIDNQVHRNSINSNNGINNSNKTDINSNNV